MTENKKPLVTENALPDETKKNLDKGSDTKASEKSAAPKSSAKKNTAKKTKAPSSPMSKLALFALIVAIGAPIGHYFWQQQQDKQLVQTLTDNFTQENSAALNLLQSQLQQNLKQQQNDFNQQLQRIKEQTIRANKESP